MVRRQEDAPGMTEPEAAANHADERNWIRIALAWFRLTHPLAITVVLAATAGFAVLFSGGSISAGNLVLLLLAMGGGQIAIGAVNEIADISLDRVAKPWKPIPSGLVTVRGAWTLTAAGLVLMVACGVQFGMVSLALLCLGTGLGLAYDLWFKRGRLAWLPYTLALPLLPIWVQACVSGFDPRALLLYPLGVPGTAAVYLAQSASDAASDRAAGLENPGSRLGQRRTLRLAWLLALLTPALGLAVAVALPSLGADPRRMAVAAMLSWAVVLAGAGLLARRPAAGTRALFGLLAVALVIAGFGWMAALAGGPATP
jgi:4-hydroxybenzoate polyprenyltransferase